MLFRGLIYPPPGSLASIHLVPSSAGPLKYLFLVVEDIEASRAELVERGIDVSEIWHGAPGQPPEPGRDPAGGSYVSQAASRIRTGTSGSSRKSPSASLGEFDHGRQRSQSGNGWFP